MFGRATIRLGIGPHSSIKLCQILNYFNSFDCPVLLFSIFGKEFFFVSAKKNRKGCVRNQPAKMAIKR